MHSTLSDLKKVSGAGVIVRVSFGTHTLDAADYSNGVPEIAGRVLTASVGIERLILAPVTVLHGAIQRRYRQMAVDVLAYGPAHDAS